MIQHLTRSPVTDQRVFKLNQPVTLDGTTAGVIVGKTVATEPVYDVRVSPDGDPAMVMYVSASRLV